jgi:hypothetical protein
MEDMVRDNAVGGLTESVGWHANAPHLRREDVTAVMKHVLKAIGPHFTPQERSRLTLIADLSDLIAHRDWVVAEIGCPIHQAGLPRSSDADLFSQHWDGAIYDLLREQGQSKDQAESPQVLVID